MLQRSIGSLDPRKAKIIELRFFGGLTAEETADLAKDRLTRLDGGP